MGYSHEYPLHWRSRRLWAWRDEFGSERFWNLRAGKMLAKRGAANFWSDLAT
jgi:acyl-CoA dehydrogenase